MDEVQQKIIDFIEQEYPKLFSSQRAFANAVGCDEKTIRSLFTSRHKMTMDLFLKISKAFGIQPSELLRKVGQ